MKYLPLMLLLSLSACPRPIPAPVPPSPGDGGEVATCVTACARLTELACLAALPTPEGASCVTVCQNIQESGVMLWNLDCISRSPSCNATDVCNR